VSGVRQRVPIQRDRCWRRLRDRYGRTRLGCSDSSIRLYLRETTVDRQVDAGDVAAAVRRQEQGCSRQLFRAPGGSAGIGLGTAKRFVEEGAQLFITGRRQSELDTALAAIGGEVTAIQGDVSKLADIDRIYDAVKAKAGRVDVLFANAGFYEFGTFGDITEEHFDKTFNTNVRGLLFTVQKALPLLSKGSSVIMTGSIAGSVGISSMSVHRRRQCAPSRVVGSSTSEVGASASTC
jgi:hypothetical protein